VVTKIRYFCAVLATLKTQETMNRQFKVVFYLRSGYKTKDGKAVLQRCRERTLALSLEVCSVS